MTPIFSLCHSTARLPDGWRKAEAAWFQKCDHPENVEYILGYDATAKEVPIFNGRWGHWGVVVNHDRQCAVDGWNATGRASTGKFLITVADDWFPCEHWDTELLKVIPNLDADYAVKVRTVTCADTNDDTLLLFSILTRSYYERLTTHHGHNGGFFYQCYMGMVADNDFTECVKSDGVLINATHLLFPHFHPAYGTAEMDDTYRWQQQSSRYETGYAIFEQRKANGFTK